MQNELDLTPLTAISPLDGRYAAKLKPLRASMGEYGYMRARVQVEVAWFIALSRAGMAQFAPLSEQAQAFLLGLVQNFSPADASAIKQFEKTTNHDVKAVEYWIKSKFADQPELQAASEFVHFACTPAMEIYRGICHIAKEGTFCLENEEPYTLADRPVSLNFETQNCENKLFFTYFAK